MMIIIIIITSIIIILVIIIDIIIIIIITMTWEQVSVDILADVCIWVSEYIYIYIYIYTRWCVRVAGGRAGPGRRRRIGGAGTPASRLVAIDTVSITITIIIIIIITIITIIIMITIIIVIIISIITTCGQRSSKSSTNCRRRQDPGLRNSLPVKTPATIISLICLFDL